jgi:hypothetical protein
MLLKGPGKIDWHDAGSMLVGTDESGNVVKQVPKGVTPDTKYGKETVGAEKLFDATTVPASTRYTQDQENNRQRVGLTTVPASAVYTQGQENARQATGLGTVPASTIYTQQQENDRAKQALDNKPLSETQGNAAAFGMRAKVSNDIFDQLEKSGADVGSMQNMLAQSRITNAVAPGWAQQAEQAKKNFMSAVLRKESGAAISASEYDAEDRKYFPQPGDSDGVKAQKRAARDLAIEALRIQAGSQGGKAIDAHGTARVSSDADYAALPSGATFVGPDGKTRRKP